MLTALKFFDIKNDAAQEHATNNDDCAVEGKNYETTGC
jgi:hypothetical protein